MVIKFVLYAKNGTEYPYLMSNDRKFYFDFPGADPADVQLRDDLSFQTSLQSLDSKKWRDEIRPQLLEIQNMSEEEFVLFKLKHG